MSAATAVVTAIRFPLLDGDLAGCDGTLTVSLLPEFVGELVPATEPCEGRCGALVGASMLSGEDAGLGLLPGPLGQMRFPAGFWEAPHDDVDDDGRAVQAVVFHSVDRCRDLRAGGQR